MDMKRGILFISLIFIALFASMAYAVEDMYRRVDGETFKYWFELTYTDIYPNANKPYVDEDPSYPGQTYYFFDNVTIYVEGHVIGNDSDIYILNYYYEDGSLIWSETFNTSSFNYTFPVGDADKGPGMYRLEIIHRMSFIYINQSIKHVSKHVYSHKI